MYFTDYKLMLSRCHVVYSKDSLNVNVSVSFNIEQRSYREFDK